VGEVDRVERISNPNSSTVDTTTPTLVSNGHLAATPLHAAVESIEASPNEAFLRIASLLDRTETDVDATDARGITPLMLAARSGNEAIVEQLLAKGAKAGIKTAATGDTALHLACSEGQPSCVRSLLDHSVDSIDVNARNLQGATPFFLAVEAAAAGIENAADVAELLLQRGADANAACGGTFPLHLMAVNGLTSLLQTCILTNRIDLDAVDDQRNSALHGAARGNDAEMLSLLLQRAPQLVGRSNGQGATPLHVALDEGNFEFARMLGGRGLLAAASTGDAEGAELALRASKELESSLDEGSNTAVHCAAAQGHSVVLERLCTVAPKDFARCLNLVNRDGDKPLHLATKYNQAQAVAQLLASYPYLAVQMDEATGNYPVRFWRDCPAMTKLGPFCTWYHSLRLLCSSSNCMR
jgi:ankyrin repeat protein